MAELAVVDDKERERIREALKQYKSSHGNIGDSKLYERMYYVLDPQHLVYLSQSTMQRFIRGTGRTTDEAVWALKKFVERVMPAGPSGELAKSFAEELLVPVATEPKLFEPLEFYQGRYELYVQPSKNEFFETEFGAAHQSQYILVPAADPRYLKIWTVNDQTATPDVTSRFLVRCGTFQFLLVSSGAGGASFTLLSHIEDDPLTLQGTMLQTASAWPPEVPSYDFRLVRIQGPEKKPKSHTGQYGKKANDRPDG